MYYEKTLIGKYVDLKSVSVDDAEFTIIIRNDEILSKFLPKIKTTIEQQIKWIKKQQEDPSDYFFVVWDKEGNRIGTMGLYNIHDGKAESGRLVVKGNAFQAIETQLLCVDFGFEVLGLEELYSYVMSGNESALRCVQLFGSEVSDKVEDKNGDSIRNVVSKKVNYYAQRKKVMKLLHKD